MAISRQRLDGSSQVMLLDEKVVGIESREGEQGDPASASGAVRNASTPTTEKSIVRATRRARQPFSALTPPGTAESGQTTENSSGARVTEKKPPRVAGA
jgi:hypothetical protein